MSTELQSSRELRLYIVKSGSISILVRARTLEKALDEFFANLKTDDEAGFDVLVYVSDGARRWFTSARFELIRRGMVP